MKIYNSFQTTSRLLVGVGLTLALSAAALVHPPNLVESANLTNVKDTLQNSRISFAGRVDATGTSAGSSTVLVKSTPARLFKAGDSVVIGTGNYTVVGIIDDNRFTVSPVLATGDADDNDPIYLKSKPQHVITFTTASAVPNGYFRVLLPADTTTPNDGKPDDEGFDFNTTVDVSATNITNYTFGTGVATPAGGTGCTSPANYHCFDVPYTGSGAVGSTITITIGNTNGSNTPIAPAPGTTTLGTAETYPFIVRQYTSDDTLVDNASGRIAFIEGVRVTATVDPILSMTICGADTCNDVEPGDSIDGETLSSNTGATSTSTSVALGGLDLLVPRLQAQKITISTNGSGGYVLTAVDDGNMRKGTDTIDDNVTPPTAPAVLNSPGTEAYGIHPSGSHVNTGTWGTGGASNNKYSGTDTSNVLTLASYNSGPTAATSTFVTYKANISPTTAQGDYEHMIFYTATATF